MSILIDNVALTKCGIQLVHL